MVVTPPLRLLFLAVLSYLAFSSAAVQRGPSVDDVALGQVRSACAGARYPALCVRTLSSYGGPCRTRRDLAQGAVNASLARTRGFSAYLARISSARGSGRRERAALRDCAEQIGNSVDELRQTLSELKHLRRRDSDFRWHMSNAQTWVSAALTYEDSCADGLEEAGGGRFKSDVKQRIKNLCRVTSNALYLINHLDAAGGN